MKYLSKNRRGEGITEYILVMVLVLVCVALFWEPIKSALDTRIEDISSDIDSISGDSQGKAKKRKGSVKSGRGSNLMTTLFGGGSGGSNDSSESSGVSSSVRFESSGTVRVR